MMGNLIYLMVANSNRKSEQWAITMTKIFWAYRAISSWILLIIVTIFATTEFHADYIDDYDERYGQTIGNDTGLGLFMFCWIATPIWQWVGSIIIFHYRNLASVGRDIVQLAKDEKWLQVLELVKFGSEYSAEDTLIAINNTGSDTLTHQTEEPELKLKIAHICMGQIDVKDVLFRACNNTDYNTVEFLLSKFDVLNENELDQQGRSIMFYAASNVDVRTVRNLTTTEDFNMDCNIKDKDGLSIIHFMFRNIHKDKNRLAVIRILIYLIEYGNFDVNVTDLDGNTILDIALETEQSPEVQCYIKMKGVEQTNEHPTIDLIVEESEERRKVYDLLCSGFWREMYMALKSSSTDDIDEMYPQKYEKIVCDNLIKCISGEIILLKILYAEEETKVDVEEKIKQGVDSSLADAYFGIPLCIIQLGAYAIVSAMIIGLYFGSDIAILIINGINDCDNSLNESKYISFDLSEFIIIGSSIHLVIVLFICCCYGIGCYKAYANERDIVNDNECIFKAFCVFGCGLWCFFFAWMVIGFMLHSEMNKETKENKQCADAMLAWNVLRVVDIVATPVFAYLWLCFTALAGYDG